MKDRATGEILAGAGRPAGAPSFEDSKARMASWFMRESFRPPGTPLIVAATDARPGRVNAGRIPRLRQDGLARRVRPARTRLDGDIVLAVSTRRRGTPRR